MHAQQRYNVEFGEKSELSITGYTNIIPFKLTQKVITFTGKRRTFTLNSNGIMFRFTENKIDIPVSMFESDNKMALRDFKKLINEAKHPDIELTLNQISTRNIDKKNTNFTANASLDLTITGQTKSYNIPFETHRSDKRFHLNGKKRINIRDFGLEPPITMLGMIRVSEWIDIEIITDFDVNKIQDTASR
jgi:hypothetical protein